MQELRHMAVESWRCAVAHIVSVAPVRPQDPPIRACRPSDQDQLLVGHDDVWWTVMGGGDQRRVSAGAGQCYGTAVAAASE